MVNCNDLSMDSTLNIVNDCLIIALPGELSKEFLDRLRSEVFAKIQNSKIKGAVLDFCMVNIIDRFEFNEIADLLKTIELLGIESVIVGLQPGLVIALLDLNVLTDNLKTFLNLEEGLKHLTNKFKNDIEQVTDADSLQYENEDDENDNPE